MKRIYLASAFLAAVAAALLLWRVFHASPQGPAPLPHVSSGRVERLADFPSAYVPSRNVDVWLPDGYPKHGRYDVLYMNDGQMLFDATTTWNKKEWRVDEVAGALIASGAVRPFIVVGVWNDSSARHSEYFPQKPFESLTAEQQAAAYATRIGAIGKLFRGPVNSDGYLRFLVTELKPQIDRRYASNPAREHTFVMGSSMGGLISMYALLEYPGVFGGAACLSTHWPGIEAKEGNPIPDAFFTYLREKLPAPGSHRLYFDHGTETIDAWYPALQRQADAVMRERGWDETSWVTRTFEGADHTEVSWAARLDVPLKFLLGQPAAGSPSG
jgi:pimeloyl-ACP methyl ester carboxylesterase